MRALATASLFLAAAACSQVQSSAFVTARAVAPSGAPVSVGATRDPVGAEELGVVEAHGSRPGTAVAELVSELCARVAAMGGDHARIDGFATRYETVVERFDYECGTTETVVETQTVLRTGADGVTAFVTESVPVERFVSKTCTGERPVEVATLTLVGRAFRLPRGQR